LKKLLLLGLTLLFLALAGGCSSNPVDNSSTDVEEEMGDLPADGK
jgi:hypothetical protein